MVMLPPLRKEPKQSRSRLLLKAVKEACLIILRDEGVKHLTIERLVEVAGVAVGSVYQYFPNMEAVVAELYKDLAYEHAKFDADFIAGLSESSGEEVIANVVAFHIDFHRQLLTLHFDFHCKYHRCFDLHQWIYEANELAESSTDILMHIIDNKAADHYGLALSDKTFIILRVLASIVMDMLDERPEMIMDPNIEDTLVRMCMSILR